MPDGLFSSYVTLSKLPCLQIDDHFFFDTQLLW